MTEWGQLRMIGIARWQVQKDGNLHAAYRAEHCFSLMCGGVLMFAEIDGAYRAGWEVIDCAACREAIERWEWPPDVEKKEAGL